MRLLFRKLQKPVTAMLLLTQTVLAQQGSPASPLPRHVPPVPGGYSFQGTQSNGQENPGEVAPVVESAPEHSVNTRHSEVTESASQAWSTSPDSMIAPGNPSTSGLFDPITADSVPLQPVDPTLAPGASHQSWSFNFQNAPWITVLRSFARDADFSLQLTVEPEGEFTYYDDNRYSVVQVLDIFNDHLLNTGRILIRDGNRLILTNASAEIPGNLIPFVPIHQIDALGRNELASVAIPLRNTDAAQAVDEIRQLQSPLGQVKPLTNSGRVIVTDTGSYLRRMRDLLLGSGVAAGDDQAYVYQLRHAQAEDVAKAISDFLSQNGSSSAAVAPDGSTMAGGSSSGAGQRVVAEKTTNSLLIRGTSEEMNTIQRLICDLDRAPREVLVQALLVEVELGNTNELGVELGFQDSVLFDRSVVDKLVTVSQTTTAPNGTQTTNQSIISRTAAPGFNFNNQPLGNNVAASPSTIAPQGLSNFGVGRVNGDLGFGGLVLSAGSESVNLLLRALDAQFNIDVLSRPQVRAVENHQAFIQIGQQVPVVDGVAITPVGSANPVIRQDQAGIILKVTPRISPDGRVQLDVNAEKSAFNLAPGTGVPIFTDATNGNVIEAPIKDITTADTTVSVQSGQTIVLGGMITNDQTVVVRKVPWLGDIPLIGRLFRYDLNRHKRKELLVFLTPIVLEDDGHAESLKARETELIHMPPVAFSFGDNLTGHYPHSSETELTPRTPVLSSSSSKDSLSKQPATKSPKSVQPASRIKPESAAVGGHSHVIQRTSASTSSTDSVATQQGDLSNTDGAVRNAAYSSQSDLTPSDVTQAGGTVNETTEKKSSRWGRSPNFRGFISNRRTKPSATPEMNPPEPFAMPLNSMRPQETPPKEIRSQFPQAQISPEMLRYHQSRSSSRGR